jgi:hypothetical protein
VHRDRAAGAAITRGSRPAARGRAARARSAAGPDRAAGASRRAAAAAGADPTGAAAAAAGRRGAAAAAALARAAARRGEHQRRHNREAAPSGPPTPVSLHVDNTPSNTRSNLFAPGARGARAATSTSRLRFLMDTAGQTGEMAIADLVARYLACLGRPPS